LVRELLKRRFVKLDPKMSMIMLDATTPVTAIIIIFLEILSFMSGFLFFEIYNIIKVKILHKSVYLSKHYYITHEK